MVGLGSGLNVAAKRHVPAPVGNRPPVQLVSQFTTKLSLLTILRNKLSLSLAVFSFHANVTSGAGTSSY